MSSANVLEFVKCEKCKQVTRLTDAEQINLGQTAEEIDSHEYVVYLCTRCEKRWIKIFHMWKEKSTMNWWFRGWNQFMTGKGECFVFR